MTIILVSRHPGAVEWVQRNGYAVDTAVPHLDPTVVRSGDTVIGTLPVNLAAEVCARGAIYLHLSLNLPAAARGIELSIQDMERYGARIERYLIHKA